MNQILLFPENAKVNKAVPKSKIYQFASAGNRVKNMFIREVDKILWAYKLAPETINLPATKKVQEIQIFSIVLKTGELSGKVLEAIDKSIPSPIIFVVEYKEKVRYYAAYKRPSEADKAKWVVGEYFETEWIKKNADKKELPVALNMELIYQELLKLFIPVHVRKGEPIETLVLRAERLKVKQREAVQIKDRIVREKQFNRRVEINRSLKTIQEEIGKLIMS